MTAPIRRRAILGGAALLGLAGPARAAPELKGSTVVFASWGGAYQDAERASYCDPFARATGARVLQDGPMDVAKFRAMVAGGTPDWDVADVTVDFLQAGTADGLFEPINTTTVHTGRIQPQYLHPNGVGCIVWSYNLGFSTQAFPAGRQPQSWADLFDLARFPGKRMLADNPVATMEVALLADGVAPGALYPLDVERALRKLDTVKAQTVFWSTNSQSQQLLVDGEVSCGVILNGRAYDANKKGAPIGISWEQNIQSVDYLVIPRGSRQLAGANALIDTMTEAANQAKLANTIAYAPTNLDAYADIDPVIVPWLSTAPGNREKGLLIGAAYWRDNLKANRERWAAWKLG